MTDPYNMYFTPDGRFAIVVAERLARLDFRDPHTFALRHSLAVPCCGVDHMDFSADGRFLVASCEFSGQLVVVDVERQQVVRTISLPGWGARHASGRQTLARRADLLRRRHAAAALGGRLPELSGGALPADRCRSAWVVPEPQREVPVRQQPHRRDDHGALLPDAPPVATWRIPGGTPDMGGVSADGKVLWLSGRYRSEVYAISTVTGRLLARIPVGAGPHGLCVWPQPGRYSLGHTGILR